MDARRKLREAEDSMSDSVHMQQLSDYQRERRLQELEQRMSKLHVEKSALERIMSSTKQQEAQQLFESGRDFGGGRLHRPALPLGHGPSFDFPYEQTRTQELQQYGGLAASINPSEPTSGSSNNLRLAVIQEELVRLTREMQAIQFSEQRLHREVDDNANSILTAEKKVAQERDDALLKRSKRAELLQTLQNVILQYSNFLSGITSNPGH